MQYSTREEKNYIVSLLFISYQRTWFKKLDGLEGGGWGERRRDVFFYDTVKILK